MHREAKTFILDQSHFVRVDVCTFLWVVLSKSQNDLVRKVHRSNSSWVMSFPRDKIDE